MRRGTTPTHTFALPFEVSIISALRITYKQENNVILTKEKDDCTLTDNVINVKLRQEETLKFKCNAPAKVQLRIVRNDDVIASEVFNFFVNECLDNEVIQ